MTNRAITINSLAVAVIGAMLSAGQLGTGIVSLGQGDPAVVMVVQPTASPTSLLEMPLGQVLERLDPKERARLLLRLRISERSAMDELLPQLQSLRMEWP